MKKKDRTNETSINNQGISMRIIKYINKNDIDVEFKNGFVSMHRRYSDFKNGNIKNLMFPSVYGVGYIGGYKYKVSNNGKTTMEYNKWYAMIKRCYSKIEIERYPTYEKCIVCENWLNFQNFAEWLNKNYYEIPNQTMCLDKDILLKGNKIYSPYTCCIVPNDINVLFTKSDRARGDNPIGVSYHKKKKAYISQMNKDGKLVHFGEYDNPIDAFNRYKVEKENEIKRKANKYKEYLPKNVYKALINYKVKIDD